MSTWLGPPYMNRKMTLLALAGSGGALGASGFTNGVAPVSGNGLAGKEAVGLQEARQRHRAKPAADLPEKLAPGAAAE